MGTADIQIIYAR